MIGGAPSGDNTQAVDTDGQAAAAAAPQPDFYCPQCGTRYHGPGVCTNQHPAAELRSLAADAEPDAATGEPPSREPGASPAPPAAPGPDTADTATDGAPAAPAATDSQAAVQESAAPAVNHQASLDAVHRALQNVDDALGDVHALLDELRAKYGESI